MTSLVGSLPHLLRDVCPRLMSCRITTLACMQVLTPLIVGFCCIFSPLIMHPNSYYSQEKKIGRTKPKLVRCGGLPCATWIWTERFWGTRYCKFFLIYVAKRIACEGKSTGHIKINIWRWKKSNNYLWWNKYSLIRIDISYNEHISSAWIYFLGEHKHAWVGLQINLLVRGVFGMLIIRIHIHSNRGRTILLCSLI